MENQANKYMNILIFNGTSTRGVLYAPISGAGTYRTLPNSEDIILRQCIQRT